ncbi:MAG: phosphoribosylamine--glycine ligase [Nitrospinae bacterium]|nr:phosphoribosylamine--glycine ligase [Nitrospinota bacterium]
MKILIVGNGGREHALVWKASLSPLVDKIYCTPGNPGTAELAENIDIAVEDIEALADFSLKNRIDLTIVGPEVPLTLGIVDRFEERGLAIFGPSKLGAELEGSKVFSKNFMKKYGIPTAASEIFVSADKAKEYIKSVNLPLVIKADGLAAGKGVVICHKIEEAFEAVDTILLDRQFGSAGDKILVEQFLDGVEVSFMVLSDGQDFIPLVTAKDHKPVYDGNKGPNTGGLGAYAPSPTVTPELMKKIIERVIRPTIDGLASEGRLYRGVIYAGLMICDGEPVVLEYNCRFGDPETQPIMFKMKGDIIPPMVKIAAHQSIKGLDIEWHEGYTVCIVMASGGYPGAYEKGKVISGLDDVGGGVVFQAGTKLSGKNIVTNGGRVLGVTSRGATLAEASDNAYKIVSKISWDGLHYRRDIGR